MSSGAQKMLPESYDRVSEETKKVVQLFMAHAHGFLHGTWRSDEEALPILKYFQKKAITNAVERALQAWEESQEPCSAEQFVQWFAELIWEGLTDDGTHLSLRTTRLQSFSSISMTTLTWFYQMIGLSLTISPRL